MSRSEIAWIQVSRTMPVREVEVDNAAVLRSNTDVRMAVSRCCFSDPSHSSVPRQSEAFIVVNSEVKHTRSTWWSSQTGVAAGESALKLARHEPASCRKQRHPRARSTSLETLVLCHIGGIFSLICKTCLIWPLKLLRYRCQATAFAHYRITSASNSSR